MREAKSVDLAALPDDNFFAKTNPQVFIDVNNNRIRALLDTGATRSYISAKLAKHLKVKIDKPREDYQIRSGTNQKVSPVGICRLNFKLASKPFEHEFIILEESPYKMILGSNFMKSSNIVLDMAEGKFWFSHNNKTKYVRFCNAEFLCALQGLNTNQESDLDSLLGEFPDVFSGQIGMTDMTKCKFHVPGKPIAERPRRVSFKKKATIKEHVHKMQELGIIVPSESEWASPVHLVCKEGCEDRLTIDFRKINERLKSDPYPKPRIDTLMHNLGEANFLTTLDMKKGYWQIEVDADTRPFTAFICDEGKFEFTRMPFGIKPASSIFQRLVNKLLGQARNRFADAYLDDIIIYSKTWEEHMSHIRFVLEQLRIAKFTLNKNKCQFGKTTLRYLGFIISPRGIEKDAEKISPILNYPSPRNIKEVRRFLGMCGWYRHFIEKFAEIAEPLNELLRNVKHFIWTERQEEACNKLKHEIANTVTLSYPDFSKPFIVRTDASDIGVAAVISQKVNGLERPIAFTSRALSATERNYFTSEKECVGILHALKKFTPYLDGQEFELQTDNQALIWLNKMRYVNSKFVRWALRIQDFQPTITHCPGRLNVVADALSRAPVGPSEDEDEPREVMHPPINRAQSSTLATLTSAKTSDFLKDEISILATLTSDITLDLLKHEQSIDGETKALKSDIGDEFIVKDEILYKIGKYGGKIPFIPVSLRKRVLQ